MARKSSLHFNPDASNGLKDLLLDSNVTTGVHAAYEHIEKITLQLQRDTAAKGDDETTLQVLKGSNVLLNSLLLFKNEGAKDLEAEKNSTNQNATP